MSGSTCLEFRDDPIDGPLDPALDRHRALDGHISQPQGDPVLTRDLFRGPGMSHQVADIDDQISAHTPDVTSERCAIPYLR